MCYGLANFTKPSGCAKVQAHRSAAGQGVRFLIGEIRRDFNPAPALDIVVPTGVSKSIELAGDKRLIVLRR